MIMTRTRLINPHGFDPGARGVPSVRHFGGWSFASRGAVRTAGSGVAPGTVLLPFADGSFGRATVGTYQTGAAAISSSAVDALRYEDRGDGHGAVALFEGESTNLLERSEAFDVGSWTPANGLVITGDTVAAPDGNMTAETFAFAANANSQAINTTANGDIADNTPVFLSIWASVASGTELFRWQWVDKSGALDTQSDNTVTTTWQRFGYLTNSGTGGTAMATRIKNGSDGAARSVYMWAAQQEVLRFPTSYIATDVGLVTRQEDVLTYLAAQVPLALREAAHVWEVYPYWAAADLVSGDEFTIVSFGGANDVLRVRHTGSDVLVEAVDNGSVVASSNALSHSRHDKLTITVDPVNATIDVNSSTGSAGTAWAWPGGVQARVGGILGANNEFFGRIGEPLAA